MPPRSKVTGLPSEVRDELDRRLSEGGFRDYRSHAEWLTELGHPVSHTSVHRYGSRLERRIESLRVSSEMAAALVAASPDDAVAMADASIQLVQERMFQLLLASEEGDLEEMTIAARALAEAARASIAIRADRRKALAEAAERAGKASKKAGLSKNTAAAIRAAIQGGEEAA